MEISRGSQPAAFPGWQSLDLALRHFAILLEYSWFVSIFPVA